MYVWQYSWNIFIETGYREIKLDIAEDRSRQIMRRKQMIRMYFKDHMGLNRAIQAEYKRIRIESVSLKENLPRG